MPASPDSPVEDLIDAYRNGAATTEQLAALDVLLVADPVATGEFCEAMLQDARLEELFNQAEASETLNSTLNAWIEAERVEPAPRRQIVWRAAAWLRTNAGVSALIAGLFVTSVVLALALVDLPALIRDDGDAERQRIAAIRPQIVAHVAAAVDARWSPETVKLLDGGAALFAREPHELLAGTIEIKYDSGVRLVVEAPALFELTSDAAAHLALGKLTAHVPPEGRGFAVSAPGARVVDLGTEFGMEVDPLQNGAVYVYAGRVVAEVLPETPAVRKIELAEGQSLAWTSSGATSRPGAVLAQSFMRQLPRSIPLPLPNTGARPTGALLSPGEADLKWRVRAPGAETFEPAVVIAPVASYASSRSNQSVWISSQNWTSVGGDTTTTFAVEFQLSGVDVASARAVARFAADNGVTAVRLNGHAVPVPPPAEESFRAETELAIGAFFREGRNELQVDVFNLGSAPSPMALRWEWTGRGRQLTE